ncbi:effector-associated domain 2-containing protein [Saccharothrix deserti]|uniref:effector-associated domain 2-containing protein n=1 Tax=Saccharothrix deserti TaxID=2593674 RepID=UPI00131BA60B|nr:hypothetical protein [Saccharothrix deserti]
MTVHAVLAIAADPAAALDAARRLVRAALNDPALNDPQLDDPARTTDHDAVLLTHPPSHRFPVRLTEAVHRHNDSVAAPIRLRVVMAGEVVEALAVLDSDALRSAHAASSRPVTIAVTDSYLRDQPIADPDRHRAVGVPGLAEPVWLLDARVPDVEALFHALMAVPSMRTEGDRRLVLGLLPPAIAAAVPHHPIAALHVSGLLQTCIEHEHGLNALRHALHVVEGEDSTPMRRFDTLLSTESNLEE